MASGKNHDRAILFASPLVLIVGCYQFGELGIIAGAAHFIGGWYLSPDLDTRVSLPYKRWGIVKHIWHPYQKLIPHRNWKSHAPILGSLLRLAYLTAWLIPFWFIFPDLQRVQWSIDWGKALAFLVGVELSALNHLALDGLLVPLPKRVKHALAGGKRR